jgi:nitronate monooxygenase
VTATDTPRTALREQLRSGLTVPAVAAPTFLASGVDLAAAACASGVMGTLTLNHCRTVGELDQQLRQVQERLDLLRATDPDRRIGPLAVNTSLSPDVELMQAFVDTCARRGVALLITANGDPADLVRRAHDAGLPVAHDVTSMRFATKAIAAGVDGLIAIGAGGGGHSGAISAIAFVPVLRSMYDGLIVLAGSVSTGAQIRAAEVLGADLAYLGTRFIATAESMAPAAYKTMLTEERAEDLLYTPAVNGVAANWMQASLRRVGLDPAALPVPVGRTHDHLPDGVRPWRDVWSAGQGVSLIHDIPPVDELVARLRREYADACRVDSLLEAALP